MNDAPTPPGNNTQAPEPEPGWVPVNHTKAAAADADEAYLDTYREFMKAMQRAGFEPSLIPVGPTDRVMLIHAGDHQMIVSDNGRPLPWDSANITAVVIADSNGHAVTLPGDSTPEQVSNAATEMASPSVG